MSTKAKSKTASADSRPPGKPDHRDQGDAAPADEPVRVGEGSTIYLVSDRSRRGSWMIGGGVIGALLLWKLGTVAATAGLVLFALGLYHTWFFVRTLRFDPGAFVVHPDRSVELPAGLCRGRTHRVQPSELRAAYFLRRAVPWSMGAPVLVIEIVKEGAARALLYPRDWFAGEADQRRVMHAVLPILAKSGEGAAVDRVAPAE